MNKTLCLYETVQNISILEQMHVSKPCYRNAITNTLVEAIATKYG